MKSWLGAAALTLGAVGSGTAWAASDKEAFAFCDRLTVPGKDDAGLGRPADAIRQLSFFSNAPADIIAACTNALASPRLLPAQALRRAHLLRARAAARLQTEDFVSALEDIDRAEAATAGLAGDRLYRRSMAVSLKLLRALTYDQMGDKAGSARVALQAAADRHFALEVQRVAAHLLLSGPAADSDPTIVVANRLEPGWLYQEVAVLNATGNFKAIARLAPALATPEPPVAAQADPDKAKDSAAAVSVVVEARSSILNSLLVAYARAANGDVAGARQDLAATQSRIAALEAGPAARVPDDAKRMLLDPLHRLAEINTARVEARIALVEGRPADAAARLKDVQLPNDSATAELFGALRAAVPAGTVQQPDLPGLGERAAIARKALLDTLITAAMIEPETVTTNDGYKRSRPNIVGALIGGALSMGTSLLQGVQNTDGFRATPNPDGSVKVELTDATTSAAVVREMTLLRAAELAIEAGKPAFVITGRNDYVRTLTGTQYGRTVSSVTVGFKTDMVVRFLGTDETGARALDAREIVEALGPFYYKDKTS